MASTRRVAGYSGRQWLARASAISFSEPCDAKPAEGRERRKRMGEEFLERRGLVRKDFLKLGGSYFPGRYRFGGLRPAFHQARTEKRVEIRTEQRDREAKARSPRSSAERVKAGELPPVEERLPDEPLVVEPVERMGIYGGEWRTALLGASDTSWLGRTIGYDNLVRWDVEFEKVIPNVAGSFEASEDAREYTFRLRPGMKWSDGEPFTADDIVFAMNDVLNNEELYPAPLFPGEAEKIDDYTVRISLEKPDGLFLKKQAMGDPGVRSPAILFTT